MNKKYAVIQGNLSLVDGQHQYAVMLGTQQAAEDWAKAQVSANNKTTWCVLEIMSTIQTEQQPIKVIDSRPPPRNRRMSGARYERAPAIRQ